MIRFKMAIISARWNHATTGIFWQLNVVQITSIAYSPGVDEHLQCPRDGSKCYTANRYRITCSRLISCASSAATPPTVLLGAFDLARVMMCSRIDLSVMRGYSATVMSDRMLEARTDFQRLLVENAPLLDPRRLLHLLRLTLIFARSTMVSRYGKYQQPATFIQGRQGGYKWCSF
jgi:hypothetical protein